MIVPVANLTGPRQDLIGAKGAQPGETTHPLDVSVSRTGNI